MADERPIPAQFLAAEVAAKGIQAAVAEETHALVNRRRIELHRLQVGQWNPRREEILERDEENSYLNPEEGDEDPMRQVPGYAVS